MASACGSTNFLVYPCVTEPVWLQNKLKKLPQLGEFGHFAKFIKAVGPNIPFSQKSSKLR